MKQWSRAMGHILPTLFGLALGGVLASRIFDFGTTSRYFVNIDGQVEEMELDRLGIEKDVALFLARLRGGLAESAFTEVGTIKNAIRRNLIDGYARDGALLDEWGSFGSDRERFIAYLMLRVNSSLPIYEVMPLQNSLSEMLFDKQGNCGHQTYRLLMVLDIFSIKGRAIDWHSPSLEGHQFVDAYDSLEGRAYFLDSTSNLMASVETTAADSGFLDILTKMDAATRKSFLKKAVKAFPHSYSQMIGVDQDFRYWSENNLLRSRDSIIAGFTYELPMVIDKWQKDTPRKPSTLCELADKGEHEMGTFEPENCLSTTSLMKMESRETASPYIPKGIERTESQ